MFRDNPAHDPGKYKGDGGIIDSLSWSLYSGAPVRSSPAFTNNSLVYGTTTGELLNVNMITGSIIWRKNYGTSVNSSPAVTQTDIYFSDNEQSLYKVALENGKQKWKIRLGAKSLYQWKYDYYYSSPVIYNNRIFIGSDDGNIYCIDQKDGKVIWKYRTKGIVRATPAIKNNSVFIGDTEGYFYAINASDGKMIWVYETEGISFNNETEGFDRKAILSSAVIHNEYVIFGSRDGFLYCLNKERGTLQWKNDHVVSWIITSPVVVDTIVIAASSDGKFVQAVNLESGKDIWRSKTDAPVWSSPIVVDNIIYVGSFNGTMYLLDLFSGRKISSFNTTGKILSTPLYKENKIFFGCDDGNFYALASRKKPIMDNSWKRYVFFQPGLNVYFKNGIDLRIRNFLSDDGYADLDSIKLLTLFKDPPSHAVVVFATNYIPREIINGTPPLIKKFLNAGNKILVLGNNPLLYELDENSKQVIGLNFNWFKAIDIKVEHNDLRMLKGTFAAFPNKKGIQLGLPAFWTANHSLSPGEVDICLGMDENGLCSSWIKNFSNGGQFVQLWINQESDFQPGFILKVAESVIH